MSKDGDDSFELYDLRVEVIVPQGDQRRILCGAIEGDYFELKGEMINLPDGQGFSMYSLGEWRDISCKVPFSIVTKHLKLPFFLCSQQSNGAGKKTIGCGPTGPLHAQIPTVRLCWKSAGRVFECSAMEKPQWFLWKPLLEQA
jgi:hypothetical protein